MKVVVESVGNQIVSDYCFKGWLGACNQDYDVSIRSLPSISMDQAKTKAERPMPIGSVGYMKYFFDLYGIPTPLPLNIHQHHIPGIQEEYTEVETKKDITYPTFVKPLNDVKKFTGFVANSIKDFDLYPELEDWDGPYLCFPIISNIFSEWRTFVFKGKIINISHYSGDPTWFPYPNEIQKDIKLYSEHAPIAYTLDYAVVESGSVVIEANDMWAIGPYGCKEDDYFAMLRARWNEIAKLDKRYNIC